MKADHLSHIAAYKIRYTNYMNESLTDTTPATTITIIRPSTGWVPINFRELWQFRELFYILTLRDIRVRYKQTVIGAAWAVIQPFFTMVVFSLFFGNLAGIDSDGVPYPIFAYAALVPWQFFASGLSFSANSMVTNANLIKKIYFPRLIIPVSTVLSGLVDFILAFSILVVMMVVYGILPTVNIVFLPFFLLLAIITTLGMGLLLGALNVQFRDIRYTIPFMVQLLLFLTPVAYPSNLIENDLLRTVYGINPMVGVVNGFRWALLGTETAPDTSTLVSAIFAVLLFIVGIFFFRRMEKQFADVV